MKLPQWENMAIVITYDDSDGWYDHVMPPIVITRAILPTICWAARRPCAEPRRRAPIRIAADTAAAASAGHLAVCQTKLCGPRFDRPDSVLRFIEDNWGLARIGDQSFDAVAGSILGHFNFTAPPNLKPVMLNPTTGEVSGKRGN